ncbi:hypothetical protein TSAR_013049 [Trichomalopsis sarcophagae]|uniref:Uncharacterized protein n=1 Tax=Trichomalopsis sarcophagae TaxID=543379 RepID=A0A232FKZ1_9HYME|nr:hypothetical protein TSAR_013049 [Trichomalopsis sarcophagae]
MTSRSRIDKKRVTAKKRGARALVLSHLCDEKGCAGVAAACGGLKRTPIDSLAFHRISSFSQSGGTFEFRFLFLLIRYFVKAFFFHGDVLNSFRRRV